MLSEIRNIDVNWFMAVLALAAAILSPKPGYGQFSLGNGLTSEAGSLWVGASYIEWSADDIFAGTSRRNPSRDIQLGKPVPFDRAIGGQLDTQSLFLNLQYAVTDQFETGISVAPYQNIVFEDQNVVSETTGTSDLWVHAAYGFGADTQDFGTKIGLQLKIPTTERQLQDQESIPLSEGQYDIAFEHATTIVPVRSVHVTLRTLIRHRFPYREAGLTIKPGDEAQLGLKVGGAPTDWLWLKAGYEGLWASGTEDRSGRGSISVGDKRRLDEAVAGAYITWGEWIPWLPDRLAADIWARYPLSGQNIPRGIKYAAGLGWSTTVPIVDD